MPRDFLNSTAFSALTQRGDLWFGSAKDAPSARERIWQSKGNSTSTVSWGVHAIDSALPYSGLPLGTLHEFFAPGADLTSELPVTIPSLLAKNLIEQCSVGGDRAWSAPGNAKTRSNFSSSSPYFFLWIGKRCWPTPFMLDRDTLSQCLFLDPPSQELQLWAIETALRSPTVKCIIAECPKAPLTTLKRFQFAARKSGATAFLLRSERESFAPTCAYSQWRINPSQSSYELPAWQLTLIKAKGGIVDTASWIVCAESSYEQREKISIRILSKLGDRCCEESEGERWATEQKEFGT
jgi:hypothetical protein